MSAFDTSGFEGWAEANDVAGDPPKGEKTAPLDAARPLIDFANIPPDPQKTLLGNRFLCREGGMLFVGPSGIGKTSASVQQDLLWSTGEPAFGIVPARPMKILTIQAEDDDGDLSEIVSGIKSSLKFTPEQIRQSRENCVYVTHKSLTGWEFLEQVVKLQLEERKPDILRINPLQAYLGGDIKNPEVTARFLRNSLNPLLAQYQCAAIIVHHTPKTNFRDTKEWKANDWMYAGAGSADITNWCRAVLIIDPTDDPRIFRFIAAKRASRIGWQNELTGEREFIRHFGHANNGSIFWREALEDEVKQAGKAQKQAKDLLLLIPEAGSIAKSVLLSRLSEIGIGQGKGKGFLAELVSQGAAFEWRVPRPRTNPEVRIARYEQPVPPAA
jgi:AAA domain